MKESIGQVVNGLKPAMVMVAVQVILAGVNVFLKLATNDGMSITILVAYRFLFATVSTAPLAFIFERNKNSKLSWKVVIQSFLCALFGGTLAQHLYVESLVLTSTAFAQAMFNLIPAITFIMGVIFGLETLAIKTPAGKAKVAGTLLGVIGALVLTLYKGAELHIWSTQVNLLNNSQHHMKPARGGSRNRVIGALLAASSGTCTSLWLILQTKLSKGYPYHYTCTTLFSVMASMQSVGFALFTEMDWSQWKLGWNIRLLAVAYTGTIGCGLLVVLTSWCVSKRGPLFVSVFTPLLLVLVAILGSLLLDEKLHMGSVIGAILIVCGLYVVLWGKSADLESTSSQLLPSKSSDNDAIKDISVGLSGENGDNIIPPAGLNGLSGKKEDGDEKSSLA